MTRKRKVWIVLITILSIFIGLFSWIIYKFGDYTLDTPMPFSFIQDNKINSPITYFDSIVLKKEPFKIHVWTKKYYYRFNEVRIGILSDRKEYDKMRINTKLKDNFCFIMEGMPIVNQIFFPVGTIL